MWRRAVAAVGRAGIAPPPSRAFAPLGARPLTASPPDGLSGGGASTSRALDAADGPGLRDFMPSASSGGCGAAGATTVSPRPADAARDGEGRRKAYIETYGCQMNVNDSEIVASVLASSDYDLTDALPDADAILVNTCAIRENAESKVWHRLRQLRAVKRDRERAARREAKRAMSDRSGVFVATPPRPPPVVGVLGCMGERLKEKILETDGLADLVAGPDAYRDLPRLIDAARGNAAVAADGGDVDVGSAVNVQLSLEETYADVAPVRRADSGPSAFVSIMRGCDNMCAFCIVPFTRGRERSRPIASVLEEVRRLSDEGYREVTLLGQNVNSYADGARPSLSVRAGDDAFDRYYADGFRSVYKPRRDGAVRFAELLDAAADVNPEMRVRFTSPHPKDFPDEVFRVIADRPNVAKQLHMPAQSGSTSVLERMRRGYTREAYVALARRAREEIPGVALSSDFIAGFCGETEEEHADTVALMREMRYEHAFMFAYSMREKTAAARKLTDDVPEETKRRRLAEIIAAQREEAEAVNAEEVGRTHCVLVEGASKKSEKDAQGRTCTNKRVVLLGGATTTATYDPRRPEGATGPGTERVVVGAGDYVAARVVRANASTLFAEPVGRTTLVKFQKAHGAQWSRDG